MSSKKSPKKDPVPTEQGFGEWLRQLRQERKLQQRVVAAAGDMDVAVLSKVELGQRLPTEEQTSKLAKFFKVNETEAKARRLVAKFYLEGGGDPASTKKALYILAEQAPAYGRAKT